jgi:CHAD domain-containing protein
LNERARRLFVASEALAYGYGGISAVSRATGVARRTIRVGIAELHQMRIAAKCLRYTLEVFRPFYGKTMDRYIAAAIVLQRALGTMHDFDVWQLMLPGFLPKGRSLEGKKETIDQLSVYCRRERDAAYLKMAAAWESQKKTGLWDRLETLT